MLNKLFIFAITLGVIVNGIKGSKVRRALATMPNIARSCRDSYILSYIKYSRL